MTGTVRKAAPQYSSADRFREWEDVVQDSFACNYEDHPVTRRDELHTSWRWTHCAGFFDLAMEKHWRSSDAVDQQVQGLIQIWYTAGTYDQLNLGRGSCGGASETDPQQC